MSAPRFLVPLAQGHLQRRENIAVFNASSDRDIDELAQSAVFEADHFDAFSQLQARGHEVFPKITAGQFDRALVNLSKHTDWNKAMIARAVQHLGKNGDLLIEGAKSDGVDSLIKSLKALGISCAHAPKSHGKIIWLEGDLSPLLAWSELEDYQKNSEGYYRSAGIFSSEQTDKGTKFLIDNFPTRLKGRIAELGAGYGALAKPLISRNEDFASLELFEISHQAVEACKRNIQGENVQVHWSDLSDLASMSYDVIFSNPPFHKDQKSNAGLGKDFIKIAAHALKGGGDFVMVANRHLPYEHSLNHYFLDVKCTAQSNAYKVFHARRPHTRKR